MADELGKLKFFAMIVILILTIISGMLPVYFGKSLLFNSRMISVGNCFTAGIFLTMALSHILLEASESEHEEAPGKWLSSNLHLHIFLMTFIVILGMECMLSKDANQENLTQSGFISPNSREKPPVEMTLLNQSEEPRVEKQESIQVDLESLKGKAKIKRFSFSNFVLITAAMSIHSMSAGLALGVQENYNSVLSVLVGSHRSKTSHPRSQGDRIHSHRIQYYRKYSEYKPTGYSGSGILSVHACRHSHRVGSRLTEG